VVIFKIINEKYEISRVRIPAWATKVKLQAKLYSFGPSIKNNFLLIY